MPIYEYTCIKCDEEFECIVFSGDTVTCPECGTEKVRRKMSACSFKSSGSSSGDYSASSGSSSASSCAGCSGGSCATCH